MTGDRISELGESLQADRVEKAAAKLTAFKKFKKDVGIAVCRLEIQANELRQKIRDHILHDEDGLYADGEDDSEESFGKGNGGRKK